MCASRGIVDSAAVSEVTVFEAVGGMPFFVGLVDRFYEGVRDDPELLALYPRPDDLSGSAPAHAVPRAVLGRSHHVQRGTRPPTAADAAHALRDRP